jgi:hypothetical protein
VPSNWDTVSFLVAGLGGDDDDAADDDDATDEDDYADTCGDCESSLAASPGSWLLLLIVTAVARRPRVSRRRG